MFGRRADDEPRMSIVWNDLIVQFRTADVTLLDNEVRTSNALRREEKV